MKTVCDGTGMNGATDVERGFRGVRGALFLARVREYVEYDSVFFRQLMALVGLVATLTLWVLAIPGRTLSLLAKTHCANCSKAADRLVEAILASAIRGTTSRSRAVRRVLSQHIEDFPRTTVTEKFYRNPERMLRARMIVLKSPKYQEKGALLMDYNYTFPFIGKFFNVPKIAERYSIILEPGWVGYFDLDVLCYCGFEFPVFVETNEPRDREFLERLGANLRPVHVAANWWVDHRVLTPIPGVTKDVDVIMIAAWARYKRHWRFFEALAILRRAGEKLRVVLVGYPGGWTKDEVYRQAKYHGVQGSLEMYEELTPTQVNEQLNRAKVNVLWSRKEGPGRATIEGMCAGVPCIMRRGFNFGFEYPYINEKTGRFATEEELPTVLMDMRESYEQFRPREWVLANMSCQAATRALDDALSRQAAESGGRWTEGLAVKVSHLNGMAYWEPSDEARFAADYDFLKSMRRPRTDCL